MVDNLLPPERISHLVSIETSVPYRFDKNYLLKQSLYLQTSQLKFNFIYPVKMYKWSD